MLGIREAETYQHGAGRLLLQLFMEKCMKMKKDTMTGGVLMLCGLVVLLGAPMVIGHFALKHAPAMVEQASV